MKLYFIRVLILFPTAKFYVCLTLIVGDFQNNIFIFAKFVKYKRPLAAEHFGEYKYHHKKGKKQKPPKSYGIEIVS